MREKIPQFAPDEREVDGASSFDETNGARGQRARLSAICRE
jgi:hypothetical protein